MNAKEQRCQKLWLKWKKGVREKRGIFAKDADIMMKMPKQILN